MFKRGIQFILFFALGTQTEPIVIETQAEPIVIEAQVEPIIIEA